MSKSFYSYTNILTKNMAELVNFIKKKSKNKMKKCFFLFIFCCNNARCPRKIPKFSIISQIICLYSPL